MLTNKKGQSTAVVMPLFEGMARKYDEIIFVKCDIDEVDRLVTTFDICVTPSFLLFKSEFLIHFQTKFN